MSTLRRQPRWALVALVGILAVAAFLYSWNLGHSGLSTYYAAAARSMSRNVHALLFGALDPAATSTLDKLSGFLVPQALAIRLFGFHAWALTLPQVVEGVVTVFASYLVGTRWRGPVMGLATASVMTVTPMLAAMFGKPMEDGMLTMTMVLAFAAWQRAVLSRHWAWLLLAGGWVAVGFQAKMLQSWLILPALGIGYLLATTERLRVRMLRVAIAGAVTLLLSISWIGAIQLTPAADRPYVDGSTNDNAFSMVFGYNGIDRIIPGAIPGAVPQLDSTPSGGQSTTNRTATSSAGHSPFKLVLPQFTTQIGWLYPAALAGLVLGLVRRRRDRAEFGTVATLGVWAGVTAAVLSVAFVPHATYFAVIALPIALLSVFGAIEAARRYRAGSRVPALALIVVQSLWGAAVAATGPAVLVWIAIPVLVLGATAAIGLAMQRSTRPFFAVAIAAALLGPVVWSACVIGPGGGGSASDAFAGPRSGTPSRIPSGAIPAAGGPTSHPMAHHAPGLTTSQTRLERYILPRRPHGSWLFATDTMAIAVSFTLYSPYQVTELGGFSRQAPHLTLPQLRGKLRDGAVRFVLLDDRPNPGNRTLDTLRTWVSSTCAAALHGSYRDGSNAEQTLYDCAIDGRHPVALTP